MGRDKTRKAPALKGQKIFMEDLYESVPYSYSCRAGIDVEQSLDLVATWWHCCIS